MEYRVVVKDGLVYLDMSGWEFIRNTVANEDARERYADDIKEIHDRLQAACLYCGKCCRQTEHIVIHEYETPRIAHLLKERFGIEGVLKHIYYRPIPFNRFTQYVFYFKDICPFLVHNRCAIEESRPLVCKMFPLYFEFFLDREDPILRQEPVFNTCITKGAPCEDESLKVHAILERANGGDLARAVVWDRIEDRPEDVAFLFARPSEPSDSLRHLTPHKFKDKVFARLSIEVLSVYNQILGEAPHILHAPETVGLLALDREHAEELCTSQAREEAEKSADDALMRLIDDYSELIFEDMRRQGMF